MTGLALSADVDLLVLVMAAAAVLCFPSPAPFSCYRSRAERPDGSDRAKWQRVGMAAAAVLALGLLLGLWPWWAGPVPALVVGLGVSRIPEGKNKSVRAQDRHRLAIHADLLAACLDTGMAVGPALLAVAEHHSRPDSGDRNDATGRKPAGWHSPSGRVPSADSMAGLLSRNHDPIELLGAVAALLMLGADPQRAWLAAQPHPDLRALASAARRSASGGTRFAEAVREHAVNLRASARSNAQREAGRAGVAMTAPLGLCFLPAFLCLGLAPVVVGLLATLRIF